ncbi:hypothetical protein F511_18929 [Dorcoceras hygrometricum]|uniref:Uncharacterized protein n=1 Tax=Dorcoceras hygrometricum TaxID=472368 RepID=A0A2Z7AUX2_9LAMI|nr:hypothetical protein F511_18929 [Dorcoceras hygrometricum]
MKQITKTTSCFLFLVLISFSIFLDKTIHSSNYYAPVLPIILVFFIVFLIVFAVRTTIVTCITVVVLLAFAGKRRRVLVKEGRKITSDVAMYLVEVLVKERSLVAFACATLLSMVMTMTWFI